MNIIACLSLAIIFSTDVCLAQSIDDDTNNAIQFFAPALSGAIASVQGDGSVTTDPPSQETTPNVEATASSQTLASTSRPTSSTSSQSSTASTAASSSSSSSSTTSAAKSSSSTTSVAKPSSTVASPGHHPSAKIGIGVGVPLGIIFLALIGFLTLRHQRYKKASRLRHHGIIAAAGLYPVIDEADQRAGETGQRNTTDNENESETQGLEKDDVHEIQGTEIPAYSRELIGSPGLRRQELSSRRGSV